MPFDNGKGEKRGEEVMKKDYSNACEKRFSRTNPPPEEATALDMGTGTGLMGVVMGLYGAARVVFSDISPLAARNARGEHRAVWLDGQGKRSTGRLV